MDQVEEIGFRDWRTTYPVLTKGDIQPKIVNK